MTSLLLDEFKEIGSWNSSTESIILVTLPAEALAFLALFLLYLMVKVVFDGAIPNLSESNSLDGSNDVSEI